MDGIPQHVMYFIGFISMVIGFFVQNISAIHLQLTQLPKIGFSSIAVENGFEKVTHTYVHSNRDISYCKIMAIDHEYIKFENWT